MRYLETYNASEGFFAVQNAIDNRARLLLLDVGVFYEFMPIEEVEKEQPTLLPIWKVEEGKVYALVITVMPVTTAAIPDWALWMNGMFWAERYSSCSRAMTA